MKKFIPFLLILLSTTAFASKTIKVNGAGASFPYPIYSKWFAEYAKVEKNVQFNYQAIGSGGGIRQLIKQTVDFGASDAPMKEKDMKKAAWPVMHVPTVLGAVAAAYNVPGIANGLKLDGKTLAHIFLGKITKWNDEAIQSLNKGVNLPNQDILIVHRSDGSGTTAVFSDYLSKVSPEWKNQVGQGKSLRWPSGVGAKGNQGITGVLKQTPGAIGYVELAYAKKENLSTVALKNLEGEYALPSVDGVSRSAATLKDMTGDLRVSITNAPGKGVYPISSFTYILLPVTKETIQLKEVKKFLGWALTEGQNHASSLHYAPLPKELVKILKTKIK